MLAIFRKEVFSFLNSFVGYLTIGLFLLVTGLFLWVFPDTSILEYGYASLESLFTIAPFIFMFLIPAVTMRTLAEERKEGTFELLATWPVTDWQIILGKFAACVSLVLLSLIPTIIYYYTVYQLGVEKGNLDTGATIGSYIGLFFLGSSFVAIGIFCSSITKNQVVAFVLTVFLAFFTFSGFDSISTILALESFGDGISGLGINAHYESISRGVVDSRDVIYFLSFIAFFLVLTRTVLGGRKW